LRDPGFGPASRRPCLERLAPTSPSFAARPRLLPGWDSVRITTTAAAKFLSQPSQADFDRPAAFSRWL